jgi:glycosyltransferase involved in cell wall biosynthesis
VLAGRPGVPPLLLAGGLVEQSGAILKNVNEAPLAGNVRHVGYVNEPERRRLLERASMLVIPSLEEGFGLPALEAMTMGVPVIASRRGALPEVIGEAGTLVDALDDVAFAAAIDALLADPARRRHHSDAGVLRAREFSWDDGAARLMAAYRAALAQKRGTRSAEAGLGAKL